eukprot:7380146-Prymnesium_polylepis.2
MCIRDRGDFGTQGLGELEEQRLPVKLELTDQQHVLEVVPDPHLELCGEVGVVAEGLDRRDLLEGVERALVERGHQAHHGRREVR